MFVYPLFRLYKLLIGASLSEPHCYVANRGKRNALWCVRTRNFSTLIKIPSACDRNFYQFVVNLPIVFQVHNFCVNLHGFAFRKTLHISQDVICWQSWSNNNSKYGLVRRTRCFVRVGEFAFDNSCSYTAIAKC